jgi:hypothetical protein
LKKVTSFTLFLTGNFITYLYAMQKVNHIGRHPYNLVFKLREGFRSQEFDEKCLLNTDITQDVFF